MLAKRRPTTTMKPKDSTDSACVARSANVGTQQRLHANPGIADTDRPGTYYARQRLSSPDDDSKRAWRLLSTSKSRSTPPTRLRIRECERRSITQRHTRLVSKLVTARHKNGLPASGATSANMTFSSRVRM